MRRLGVVLMLSVIAASSNASSQDRVSSFDENKIELMQGKWTSDKDGEEVAVVGNDFFDSSAGQGRIRIAYLYGANFETDFRDGTRCFYMVTFTDRGRLNMSARGPSTSRLPCRDGVYSREIEHRAGSADFIAYTGPSFTDDPKDVSKKYPSGRWKVDDDGVSNFVIYGTLLDKPAQMFFTPLRDKSAFSAVRMHMKIISQVLNYRTAADGQGRQTGGGATSAEVKALCQNYADRLRSSMIDKIGLVDGKPDLKTYHVDGDVFAEPVCESQPGYWQCQKSGTARALTVKFDAPTHPILDVIETTSRSQAVQQNLVTGTQYYIEDQNSCTIDLTVRNLDGRG